MRWILPITLYLTAGTPIWLVGENWSYCAEINVEKDDSEGFFEISNLLAKVVGEDEKTYQINITGNVSGLFIIHRFIDILVSVNGNVKSSFFINKEDLATVNGFIVVNGFMFFMERCKNFYSILNISFNPPYKILDFPLEKGKSGFLKQTSL